MKIATPKRKWSQLLYSDKTHDPKKRDGGLFLHPLIPDLKRCCLCFIAPTLAGAKTKEKIQANLWPSTRFASVIHTIQISFQVSSWPIAFVHFRLIR